jgi:hypothetical protein
MIKHLNKKILCERTIDSFNYKEEDLIELSLTRNKNDLYKNKCDYCSQLFACKSNLTRHLKKSCKKKEGEIIVNINNINNINNNINITNVNVTNNIFILKSFDEEWDDTKIDDKSKILLLLADSKFTTTLENILENDVNLNVLVDNSKDSNTGFIFKDNKYEKINMNYIIDKSMEKLYYKLKKFRQDISGNNEYDIKKKSLDMEEKIMDEKYLFYNYENFY